MSEMRFETLSLQRERENGYDLFVSALGYESRAIAVSAELLNTVGRKIAIGFDHNKEIAYSSNKTWYETSAIQVIDDINDDNFSDIFTTELQGVIDNSRSSPAPLRIAIDVSCLNRFRVASIIATVVPLIRNGKIIVDIWYALAEFQPPQHQMLQNEFVGPVHTRFAGWFTDPGRPLALIAGLGYEQGKVMGATEYLQASRVVAFVPVSPIKEYEQFVLEANYSLLTELDKRDIIEYRVDDPVRTLATLDSAIRGLVETHNVVMLPLGPKIFTVLALLSQLFHNDSSVWRVSSGRRLEARDVKPTAHFFGMGIRSDLTPQ